MSDLYLVAWLMAVYAALWIGEKRMPKVGKKAYPYTPAGVKAAKTAAAKTGKPMATAKPKRK